MTDACGPLPVITTLSPFGRVLVCDAGGVWFGVVALWGALAGGRGVAATALGAVVTVTVLRPRARAAVRVMT